MCTTYKYMNNIRLSPWHVVAATGVLCQHLKFSCTIKWVQDVIFTSIFPLFFFSFFICIGTALSQRKAGKTHFTKHARDTKCLINQNNKITDAHRLKCASHLNSLCPPKINRTKSEQTHHPLEVSNRNSRRRGGYKYCRWSRLHSYGHESLEHAGRTSNLVPLFLTCVPLCKTWT